MDKRGKDGTDREGRRVQDPVIEDLAQPQAIVGGRLADLYREHAPAARRLAYLLTGDRAGADDLVQDAFVRIAGRFLDFRDPQSAAGYVRRTVVSLAISRFRTRKAEQARQRRIEAMEHVRAHADWDPAERDRLWRAMRHLPERQRAALVLRFYLDLSEADTADALRCRPGTVKSLVSRGLEKMREVMADEQ